jgi:hypothetical protein
MDGELVMMGNENPMQLGSLRKGGWFVVNVVMVGISIGIGMVHILGGIIRRVLFTR